MPPLHPLTQHRVHQPLLLQHSQAAERRRRHVDGVHGPAPARDVPHRQLRGRQLRDEEVPQRGLVLIEVGGLLERGRRRRGGRGGRGGGEARREGGWAEDARREGGEEGPAGGYPEEHFRGGVWLGDPGAVLSGRLRLGPVGG